MLLNEKQQKIVKWVAYAVEAIVLVLMITFACITSSQKKTIQQQDFQIKALTTQVDSLTKLNAALGAEDVFTVNVNFNLTQKNILSFSANNCQNIAKEVATMTRQELYDSLYKKNIE